MATGLFSKLWPMEVRFFKGEQPTATKLNGAFKQIESAFFMLESFLGNGTDNRVTENEGRKLLFNISNALGRADRIYKPQNKITNLEGLSKKFGRTVGQSVVTHDDASDTLTIKPEAIDLTIPVNADAGDIFLMYFKGDGKIMLDGSNYINIANDDYDWVVKTVTSPVNFIRISGKTGGRDLVIRSMILNTQILDKSSNVQHNFNTAYSTPLENANYWTMKVPCKYANPSATGANKCANNVRTCNYCIGNTYEYDETNPNYGLPKCSGAVNMNATPISYAPETLSTDAQRASYLTVQSPVLTVPNKYANKLKGFYVNKFAVDQEIPQNSCIIYDSVDSAATIKYDIPLFSAGRGDILYIKDTEIFREGMSNTKRYLVLGEYGLADLQYDMMDFHEVQMPIDSYPVNVAVYADDDGN